MVLLRSKANSLPVYVPLQNMKEIFLLPVIQPSFPGWLMFTATAAVESLSPMQQLAKRQWLQSWSIVAMVRPAWLLHV